MKGRTKVLALSFSLVSACCIGLFSFLMVKKYSHGDDMEAVEISSEDTKTVLRYDLGVIETGEEKSQTIDITSLVDFPIFYSVRFTKEKECVAFDYLNLTCYVNGKEMISMKLKESFAYGNIFEKRMSSKHEQLKFTYVLADDIPKEMLGEDVHFNIHIEARNVIG
mgnify:FL=1